jgi:DNA-directed RNA polymerase subunit H (RpoH/RPB5)
MYNIRRSWCVVMHMLLDRGYIIPEDSKYFCLNCEDRLNPDQDDCDCYKNFIDWVGDEENSGKEMSLIFYKKDETQKIMTFWISNYGVGDVRKIEDQMTQNDVKHSIVVHKNKISSSANTAIKNLKIQGLTIESFHEKDVQYIVTRSRLVPKHIICAKTTTDKILESYNVTKSQLPEIKAEDPIVRWIGAKKGQLIKIVRPSESVGSVSEKKFYDISYRIVV